MSSSRCIVFLGYDNSPASCKRSGIEQNICFAILSEKLSCTLTFF